MTSAQPSRRRPRYEPLVNGRRVAVSDEDRRCIHPHCNTRLSRYNPDSTCSRHGGWSDASLLRRGRKPATRLTPGLGPASATEPRTVTAEILLGPCPGVDDLVAVVERALGGAAASVHVEDEQMTAQLTGAIGDVLGALERVFEAVSASGARVVTNLRFHGALQATNGHSPAAPA
jgi:hypothetical protein